MKYRRRKTLASYGFQRALQERNNRSKEKKCCGKDSRTQVVA